MFVTCWPRFGVRGLCENSIANNVSTQPFSQYPYPGADFVCQAGSDWAGVSCIRVFGVVGLGVAGFPAGY